MSDEREGIDAIAGRLREIVVALRDPDLGDEEAQGLAREAAELVSEAGAEIDAALRDAAPDD